MFFLAVWSRVAVPYPDPTDPHHFAGSRSRSEPSSLPPPLLSAFTLNLSPLLPHLSSLIQSVMLIRLNYYTDPDPGSGNPPYKSGSRIRIQGKNLTKFNFSKFCGKNVLTDIEQQLYIKLAKVPRGQLRSQKSCKVP